MTKRHISDAELQYYLERGRDARSAAFHAFAGAITHWLKGRLGMPANPRPAC